MKPKIAIVMGSKSDLPMMSEATKMLKSFDILLISLLKKYKRVLNLHVERIFIISSVSA